MAEDNADMDLPAVSIDDDANEPDGKATLSRGFSARELSEFKEVFNTFDLDGDGCVKLTEMRQSFRGLKVGDKNVMDLAQMFEEVDRDNNHELDWSEFLTLMGESAGKLDEEDIDEVFKELDGDEDGYISAQEIFNFMTEHGENITMEDAHSMVELADRDHSGRLEAHEFIRILMYDDDEDIYTAEEQKEREYDDKILHGGVKVR